MIHRYCVWAFAFIFALDLTVVAKEKEKEVLPAPPPMAQGHTVTMYRGRTVQIVLRATGRISGPLKFMIRKQPRAGALGEITNIDTRTAVVTYTHDARQSPGVDSFNFAVKAPDSAVSAPGTISITVSEEPAAFSVVHALDFEQVVLGETREEEIVIQNTGGSTVSGTMTAPPPWRIVGSATYSLGRHQEQKVRLIFEPKDDANYVDKLRFSHDGRTAVTLSGSGFAPLALEPAKEIELSAEKGRTVRKAVLTLTNRTAKAREVEIGTPSHIIAEAELNLQPLEQKQIEFTSDPSSIEAIEGTVSIVSEGYRKEIPLKAYALEPVLQADPKSGFDFGEVVTGRAYKEVLRLKNTGGLAARITPDLPSGVLLIPDPGSVVIAPGEERAFEVAFEPSMTGEIKQEITLAVAQGGTIHLPLIAKSQAPATNSARPINVTSGQPAEVVEQSTSTEKAEPTNGIPAIKDIRVIKAAPGEVELGWKKPADNAVGTIVEFREIAVSEDGPPKVNWVQWRGAKFFEDNGLSVARFERIPPGRVWYIRIISIDELGRRSTPSQTIQLSSPHAPDLHLVWWLLGFAILAGGGGAGFYYYKRRRGEADSDAERLARLEKP